MSNIREQVAQSFEDHFGEKPQFIVRAPGRVNLIGEHTDYNEGFVMPMAIDRAVWIALRKTEGSHVHIVSLDFDEPISFDLHTMTKESSSPSEYVKGVAHILLKNGYDLRGWEGIMAGDVPIGAGLSSSAALELAIARTFSAVTPFAWDAPKMAKFAQNAENQWVGVNCGIMDQMISATGREGHAVMIDCRDLSIEVLPLPSATSVVILDTNTRRGLVDSAYNERRAQCEAVAAFFGKTVLRDVTLQELMDAKESLDELSFRRAKHIITENERVLLARNAMLANDPTTLGKLMIASHESLRDDFEVSSAALNLVVACALEHSGCYGARMTGAGFGGCGVALIAEEAVESFLEHISVWYTQKGSDARMPTVYVCQPTDGASVLL